MAQGKQRVISTSFWDDPWVQTLDPSEKFLYLYLLTNPLTNIAGIYEITMRRIVFDTGFNEHTVMSIMEKFEKARKAYYTLGWMVIPRWIRHQKYDNPNVRAGIRRIVGSLPDEVFNFCKVTDVEALKGFERVSHSDSDSDSNLNSYSDSDAEAPFAELRKKVGLAPSGGAASRRKTG
jgi:hypothetical protein